MIRAFDPGDLEQVIDLWLATNLTAHAFIPASYWCERREEVRALLPGATIFVYSDGAAILGFIGLMENYIAGIFVSGAAQSQGIGTALLNHAKAERETLSLAVYKKNTRAVAFYRRQGFLPVCQQVEESTGEPEITMRWERPRQKQ